jgi:hypothetical protein
MALILRGGGPSLFGHLIFFQSLVMASIFGGRNVPQGCDRCSREPIPKSAVTVLSVRRSVRRAGTSPVESLRHRGGMRDEPFCAVYRVGIFSGCQPCFQTGVGLLSSKDQFSMLGNG